MLRDNRTTLPVVLGVLLMLSSCGGIVLRLLRGNEALENLWCRFWICDDRLIAKRALYQLRKGGNELAGAVQKFQTAVIKNAASAYRWTQLGQALRRIRRVERARHCFLRAVSLAPNCPPILLRAADFYFLINEPREALKYTSRILMLVSEYDNDVFDHYANLRLDAAEILTLGIPQNRRVAQSYFRYLLRSDDQTTIRTAWNWISSRSFADIPLTSEYMEFLLKNRLYEQAARIWERQLDNHAGLASQSNYLFNGDFEQDFSRASWDWKITPAEGVVVQRDSQISHTGNWSLRIEFSGKQNIAYSHISQITLLNPGRYHLEAYIRTAEITTDEGIAFRILDPQVPARLDIRTAQFTGTTDWRLLKLDFSVSPHTKLVALHVVREPSWKFDNQIKGTLWLDSVKLSLNRASPR